MQFIITEYPRDAIKHNYILVVVTSRLHMPLYPAKYFIRGEPGSILFPA